MDSRIQKAVAYLKPASLRSGLADRHVIDEGNRFSYLQGRDLRKTGIREEELHRQALANLAGLADGKVAIRPSGPVWALFFDGNFEASLTLIDDLWTHGLREYARDPVVAIPARDVLAFCDVESTQGVTELRALVKRVWPSGDHLLTEDLYRRVDGGWHVHG